MAGVTARQSAQCQTATSARGMGARGMGEGSSSCGGANAGSRWGFDAALQLSANAGVHSAAAVPPAAGSTLARRPGCNRAAAACNASQVRALSMRPCSRQEECQGKASKGVQHEWPHSGNGATPTQGATTQQLTETVRQCRRALLTWLPSTNPSARCPAAGDEACQAGVASETRWHSWHRHTTPATRHGAAASPPPPLRPRRTAEGGGPGPLLVVIIIRVPQLHRDDDAPDAAHLRRSQAAVGQRAVGRGVVRYGAQAGLPRQRSSTHCQPPQ